MDKDRLEGKLKDLGGKVERKLGNLTGNRDMEAEGAAKQAEGKTQNAWGKVKDTARDLMEDANKKGQHITHDKERDEIDNEELDRDEDVA